jgi:hypothetical protein
MHKTGDRKMAVQLFNATWTINNDNVVSNILRNNCHVQENGDDAVVTVIV